MKKRPNQRTHDNSAACRPIGRRRLLAYAAASVLAPFAGALPAAARSSDSGLVFLTDWRGPRLIAYDMDRRAIVAERPLAVAPGHLVASAFDDLVSVSEPVSGRLLLVSGRTLDVRHETVLGVSPWLVAFAPDGRTLAAADMVSGRIALIDPRTARARFVVGGFAGAHDLRFSADGGRLYVSGLDDAVVRRIDLDARVAGPAFAMPRATAGIDHMTRTADGRYGVIVTPLRDGQELAVVDLRSGRIVRRWSSDRHYWRAYTDPFSRWFLLASDRHRGLDVVDPPSGERVGHVELAMPVDLFTAGFVGTGLVVGARETGRLALLDGGTLSVAGTLDVGRPVHSIFMNDGTGEAAILTRDGTVLTLDLVPRRGRVRIAIVDRTPLGFAPDLSAHASALNFCHA